MNPLHLECWEPAKEPRLGQRHLPSGNSESTYTIEPHSSHLKDLGPKIEDGFWMMGGKGTLLSPP